MCDGLQPDQRQLSVAQAGLVQPAAVRLAYEYSCNPPCFTSCMPLSHLMSWLFQGRITSCTQSQHSCTGGMACR